MTIKGGRRIRVCPKLVGSKASERGAKERGRKRTDVVCASAAALFTLQNTECEAKAARLKVVQDAGHVKDD